VELRAQTGPVFLTYRAIDAVHDVMKRTATRAPLFDFEALDGVRHTIWTIEPPDTEILTHAFDGADALYIADGHHRAASAARARDLVTDSAEAGYFLGVAFPSNQVRILAYNRVVKDLHGRSPGAFLAELARLGMAATRGTAEPAEKGEVSMYLDHAWYRLDLDAVGGAHAGVIDSLDCSVLQEQILGPVLGIGDVRTDRRIDFVGGARGTHALEQLVDSGRAAVAFSMYPVSVNDLMAVSDAGSIMPPKSTWFEPKLRDGLLIHEI
jgi:uncharacterized protein (DUF1015 family)